MFPPSLPAKVVGQPPASERSQSKEESKHRQGILLFQFRLVSVHLLRPEGYTEHEGREGAGCYKSGRGERRGRETRCCTYCRIGQGIDL